MTKEHINSAFDDDLNELAKLITTMGNLALSQFTAVIDGMADDEVKLKSLIENDKKIDYLESEIYNKTVEIIAIRSPQANDLRRIITAPKIATFLERIGDYSKNIIKRRERMIAEDGDLNILKKVNGISEIARELLIDVLDALSRLDAKKAKLVLSLIHI